MKILGSSEPARTIAFVTSDKDLFRTVNAEMQSTEEGRVVTLDARQFLARDFDPAAFSAVILDVGSGEILNGHELLDARRKWPNLPLLVLSEDLGQSYVRQIVKLQAADWLKKPVSAADIVQSLGSLADTDGLATGKVITFISANGGAGATTMAIHAAASFAAKKNNAGKVALVDLDFQKADCGTHLNLINEFDINGVVAEPGRIDTELLDTIQLTTKKNFSLYSFVRPDIFSNGSGNRFVYNLLDAISEKYNYVIVDMPNVETPWFKGILKNSDAIVIVMEMSIPSVRHARTLLRKIREERGRANGTLFVANKVKRSLFSRGLRRRDIEKVLDNKSVRTVTLASDAAEDALDRAVFMDEASKSTKIMRDLNRIYDELYDRIQR